MSDKKNKLKEDIIKEVTTDYYELLFSDVMQGDFFYYNKEICVKILVGDDWEALGLQSKDIFFVSSYDKVRMVRCKMHYDFITMRELRNE